MDITTLPDEMLTNVLKYTDFDTIRRIRKMNERMDKLAKRADIGRKVPFKRISCFYDSVHIDDDEGNNYFTKDCMSFYTRTNGSQHAEVVQAWRNIFRLILSRVNVSKLLFKSHNIEDELIEIMEQHKESIRPVKSALFKNCTFEMSIENAKYWINKVLPNLTTLHIESWKTTKLQNICNAEVLGSRQWKELSIRCISIVPGEFQTKLDDNLIFNVAPKCQNFRTNVYLNFTVETAVKLLKICQEKSKMNHIFEMGIVQGVTIPREVERTFKENLRGVTDVLWLEDQRTFKITCRHAGQSILLTFFANLQFINQQNH